MPGDGIGDRVHNFFAHDNLTQGQQQSHVLEGTWPVNSNVWANGQRQIDALNSGTTNNPAQNSDINIGKTSFSVIDANGLNFSQADPRHDFSKNQSQNVQPYSNGFMYGNQIYQSKQNEANFLAVNAGTDQHEITSRGFPIHEQKIRSPEQRPKVSDRSETLLPSVSFDLFSGQQQMNHQQTSMIQAYQCQQSGLNDMQQLQQQLMLRKIQDLQRQQQLQLPDFRPQNMINQDSSFAKHSSVYQSSPFNGTRNSDASLYPGTFDPGTNWMNRGSSAMQGSTGGFVFTPNTVQTQHLMNLAPQQVDQSLYGVPVSSSRGLAPNQYSHMEANGSSIPQFLSSSIPHHSNQHKFLPNQLDIHEGTCISSQKFQSEKMLEHASSKEVNNETMDIGGLQQINNMHRNVSQRDFMGQQGLDIQLETLHGRPSKPVTSSQNEVSLDPTEEKILYGMEDNISVAFGNDLNVSGEAGNLFDDGGLPSLNSGSWSALMHSAVAETSSSDMGPQECAGMNFHSDGSSSIMSPLMHRNNVTQASLPDCILKNPSALNSGSVPPSNEINNHFMELNQFRNKFQKEPTQSVATDLSHRAAQSLEEAGKWSNHTWHKKPIAEGSKRSRNGSPHSLDAERNAKAISTVQAFGQGGIQGQANGWNSLGTVPPDRDRVLGSHENEKLQSSQDNQSRESRGELVPRSTLWKSNSANHQGNKGVLSLNDDTISIENSYNVGVCRDTSPFVQNNNFLNQCKNAYPPAKIQGSENLGRKLEPVIDYNQGLGSLNSSSRDGVTQHDLENHLMKENSNDSHISNLSQHVSGGLRTDRMPDKGDQRYLASGKQNATDQVSKKSSVSRKFQYHPVGNPDEDGERSYAPAQLTQGELPSHNKGDDEEPSTGSFFGCGPSMSISSSKPFDSYPPNNASSSSQNMLELLHKVDESRDQGGTKQISSECNLSSQLPVTDNVDESTGRFQRTQSSVSQGFGLQLGPPSHQLRTSDLLSSSLKAQSLIGSMHTDHAGAQMGRKGLPRVPMSSGQSLPFPIVESQNEIEDENYAVTGNRGNENSVYKTPENYHRDSRSGALRLRDQLQEKQISVVNEKLALNRDLDSSFSCSPFMKRGSAETVPLDTSRQMQEENIASAGGVDDVRYIGLPTTSYIKEQISGSQHMMGMSSNSQPASNQSIHKMWGKIYPPQRTLVSHNQKLPSHFSEFPQPNIAESHSSGNLGANKRHDPSSKLAANSAGVDEEEHNKQKGGSGQMESSGNIELDSKIGGSWGEGPSVKNHLDDSPVNFGTKLKNVEDFGRLLKPNSLLNQRYVSLDQIRESMDAESEPNNRVSKRMKGSDNDVDSRVNLMTGQKNEDTVDNSLCSNTLVPSEDSRNVSISTPSDTSQRNHSPLGNVASLDIVALGSEASQSQSSANCATNVTVEYPQVSPQMAPSWFNHYGNFKNGSMELMYNAYKAQHEVASRPKESLIAVGKSSTLSDFHGTQDKTSTAPIDACHAGGTRPSSASTSIASEPLFCHQPLQPNYVGQCQVIPSPKKRKTDTSELHAWHKEISDGSQNIPIISVADALWSKAIHCVPTKIDDNAELIEDGHPIFRSKRRLSLTTQLMQPLFHPPPATILSTDAGLTYESVTYAVSRLALGETCSSVSLSKDVQLPPDGVNLLSRAKQRGDLHFSKVTEGFLEKARKLENDFLRLDKCSSILDLRIECFDLEKFSVINRFAKFHGPGQSDNSETASNNRAGTTQKSLAQRYVTALPMPRCPLDSVQCLSL